MSDPVQPSIRFEDDVPTPVRSEPVGSLPTGAPRRRPGALRWAIALVATIAVVVVGAGIVVFAAGNKSSTAVGPTFLPSGTIGYAEVRLDLPGSQRDNVVKLASHFPGWADPSQFDRAVDMGLDGFLGNASNGRVLFTRDVKPWFNGQVAFGTLRWPDTTTSATTDPMAAAGVYVAGLGVKDRQALQSTIDGFRKQITEATYTDEAYSGTTITTATKSGGSTAGSVSWAVTDTVLLISTDAADIKTSLDVMAGKSPSLATEATFKSLFDKVPAERLAVGWSDFASYRAKLTQQLQGMAGAVGPGFGGTVTEALKGFYDTFPDQTVAWVTASADHLTTDIVGTRGPRTPTLSARTTSLAARMPSDTLVYLEVRDVGATLHNLIAYARTLVGTALSPDQVKQIEGVLGTKLEDYLDFVQDAGLGVSFDGAKAHVGLAATVTDEKIAAERVTRLLSVLRLATVSGQANLKVTEEQVSGVTVTTIAPGPGLSLPGSAPDANPGANLPFDTSVSVAVANGQLLLGTGDFVSRALGLQEASSLASDARFSSAISSAGAPNAAELYVDLAGIKSAIEAVMPPNAKYTTDTRPYLQPLDRFVIVVNGTADQVSSRMQLYVK